MRLSWLARIQVGDSAHSCQAANNITVFIGSQLDELTHQKSSSRKKEKSLLLSELVEPFACEDLRVVRILNSLQSFGAAIYLFPIHVLYKCVHIFCRGSAVVHVVGMFIHVEDQ